MRLLALDSRETFRSDDWLMYSRNGFPEISTWKLKHFIENFIGYLEPPYSSSSSIRSSEYSKSENRFSFEVVINRARFGFDDWLFGL
jgi:hypothetical protein